MSKSKPKLKARSWEKRSFLNPRNGMAAIQANVSVYKGSTSVDADVRLSDCNRNVSLDFSFDTWNNGGEQDFRARMRKLDTILDTLHRVRDEMLIAYEVVKYNRKTHKELNAAAKRKERTGR